MSPPSLPSPVEISPSSSAFTDEDGEGDGAAPKVYWRKLQTLELLKAVVAFKNRNGVVPTLKSMADFLKEVKYLAPEGLTKEKLYSKLNTIKYNVRMSPTPGPNSSDYEKRFHELVIKAWGIEWLQRKASSCVPRSAKACESKVNDAAATNKRRIPAKETEEEIGHANNEQSEDEELDRETGESMELDGDEPRYPFPFLKRALQEFWIEKKLDLNVLQVALQKVDPVKAKHLDDQFLEIAEDELKFEIEKNELTNEIIKALGAQLKVSTVSRQVLEPQENEHNKRVYFDNNPSNIGF